MRWCQNQIDERWMMMTKLHVFLLFFLFSLARDIFMYASRMSRFRLLQILCSASRLSQNLKFNFHRLLLIHNFVQSIKQYFSLSPSLRQWWFFFLGFASRLFMRRWNRDFLLAFYPHTYSRTLQLLHRLYVHYIYNIYFIDSRKTAVFRP